MSSKKLPKKPSRRQVKRALNLHAEELGQRDNVVGLGIVPLDDEAQESSGDELAVAVYVRQKVPEDELSPEEAIPEHLELKVRGGVMQVPTKVIEQGEVSLETPAEDASDPSDKETTESFGKEPADSLGKEPTDSLGKESL